MELKPEQQLSITNLDTTDLQNIIQSMNAHVVDDAKKVAFQHLMNTYDVEVILQHILQAKINNFPPEFLTAIQFRVLGKYDGQNRQQVSEKITAFIKSYVHTSVIANLLLAKVMQANLKNNDDDEKMIVHYYTAAAQNANAEACYQLAIYQVMVETNPYSNISAGIQNLKTASQCGHPQAIQCLKQFSSYLQMHTEQEIEAIKKQQEEQRLKERVEVAQNPTMSTTTLAVHKKRTRDDMDTDNETQHEPKEQKLESTTPQSALTHVFGNVQPPIQTIGTMQSNNANVTMVTLDDAVTTISIEEQPITIVSYAPEDEIPSLTQQQADNSFAQDNCTTNPGANPYAHFGATATQVDAETKEHSVAENIDPQNILPPPTRPQSPAKIPFYNQGPK